jgi:SAM-dependent methyltransferase
MERMLAATLRAEDTHFWFLGLRRVARQMLDAALQGRRADCIVDCGAGTGRNLDWLQHYGLAVGVELTPFGLEAGRRLGRRLVRGSVAALPFADATVDVTTSFDVLYCLDETTESRALAEMSRVMKPGGVALFNVAALDILHGSHSTLTRELRRYTPARLRSRILGAGLAVERMTFTNMTPFPVALALRGLERITGRASHESESDLSVPSWPINRAFNLALEAEAAMLRLVNLPIGTSLMAVARKPPATPR